MLRTSCNLLLLFLSTYTYTQMHTLSQLPDELLVQILDYNDSTAGLAQYRLVCQHWSHLAEPLMFGKQITLKSPEGSLSLYGHLSRKPYYGRLVKHLTCEVPSTESVILEELLKLAFTPTMVHMHATIGGGDSFFKLMDAIISTKYRPSQFSQLKAIPHPRYHSSVYNSLLLKLSNTLQRVVIRLNGSGNRDLLHLFDSLHTFKCLTALDIQGLFDRFIIMETILEGCSLLREISVNVHLQEAINTKNDMANWMAVNVTIKHNLIKSLKMIDTCRADLLEFFVYKYPNMESIVIEAGTAMSRMRENMKRTFTAIQQIPSRKVNLIAREDDLLHALPQLFAVDLQFDLKEEDDDRFRIEINSP